MCRVCFPINVAAAYLSVDKALVEAVVIDLRAGVSKRNCVAPINCDRASDDLEDGFPVDCSGMRCVEPQEEAPSHEEEGVDTLKRPRQGIRYGGGVKAHELGQKNESLAPMALPRCPPPSFQQDPRPTRQ